MFFYLIFTKRKNTFYYFKKMTKEQIIKEALFFEENYKSFKTRNDKIKASKKAKEIILEMNNFYKESKEATLMDIMKRLTVIKKKLELRLKGRLSTN